jgi:regulatory protein
LHDKEADAINAQKARRYAFKLLSYKARSQKEIEERLKKKGFTNSITSSTVHYLKEIGLIDDISLANNLKRKALHTKLLSTNGAKNYLIRQGISREVIEEIFNKEEGEDAVNAERLIERKIKSLRKNPPETIRRRLYNLLLRRRYPYDTIMKALKNIQMKEE